MQKLRCMVCSSEHKARDDKFPFTKRTEVDGKMIVEGHICRHCVIKDLRKSEKAKNARQSQGSIK
jgi:hypothetical protein